MAENSKIEWCHHTFNPWIGCTKVSEGCAHCYAEKSSPANVMRAKGQETWGKGAERKRTSAANWKEPLKWNFEGDGRYVLGLPRQRVFCASLADWLDDEVPIEWLAELMELIVRTPNLDWLLLTKRPQNWRARIEAVADHVLNNGSETGAIVWAWKEGFAPPNVWIGTTVENQARADERIPRLLQIPAKVRFLSCEPLLSKVDLVLDEERLTGGPDDESVRTRIGPHGIHWVICGGESGTHARAMHAEWARSLRDQCSAAGVAFFFKQWGEWLPGCQYREGDRERFREKAQHSFCLDHHSWWVGKKLAGRMLDDRTHDEFPQVERRQA